MCARIASWVITCLCLLLTPVAAFGQQESSLDAIREGHWLEIRGHMQEDGIFEAQRVEIIHTQRYEELIGTAYGSNTQGRISLLGLEVELTDKTTLDDLDRDKLANTRLKVEGYHRGAERFSAREVAPRGEGRDRLVGRANLVKKDGDGLNIGIMNFMAHIPPKLRVIHEDPIADYALSESRTQPVATRPRNEDDLFGEGIRVSRNLLLAGLIQARWTGEDEFDLDQQDPEDRQDTEASARVRLIYRPSSRFVGVAELSHRRLWRDDDEDGRVNLKNTVIGESFAYWFDPLKWNTDFQLGRIDFDEEREWLYDQNLDGARIYYFGRHVVTDFSVSTTLSEGSPSDENTVNTMLYLSNGGHDRHLAAYIIHRATDLGLNEKRTHVGVRAYGDWYSNHRSWLEISYMMGKIGNTDAAGWGLDIGNTWMAESGLNFTLGYAMGQGDKPQSVTDNNFRQTGLQDNNSKFAGVTSFRYYGELVDPELANLEIFTAGAGFRFKRKISVDLVGHYYKQNQLSRKWIDSEIDKRPNGRDPELGWEVDFVLGWRTNKTWDLEVIAAYFEPGAAFDEADSAFLGQLQYRFRF